ncbi:MAG: MogA/MoaB family molybdenum cofactor biosynthesis protein [Proteobacteria bacterium]|nr:MogA/MoaB family molybdenum cofactor biosynthesis protein [Pseudomonadota bacterium]
MPDLKHRARRVESVVCGVITVSDTRTSETDASGGLLRRRLEGAGHKVCAYEIIPDEPERVRDRVLEHCDDSECQAVVVTGGTGLSPRDTTFEALSSILEKQLPGFGELFRSLSYAEVGSAAMLSRAVAGVCRSTVIFSIPGSTDAVRLAVDRLILPELGHLVWLLDPR